MFLLITVSPGPNTGPGMLLSAQELFVEWMKDEGI